MRVLLLEHKKRPPKNIVPHPEYRITHDKDRHGTEYHVSKKSDGKYIGNMIGGYHPASREFHVDIARASDAGGIGSANAEKFRKSGQHLFPKSVTHAVIRHIQKVYKGALKITASRLSGANPGRSMNTPLRKPDPAEDSKRQTRAVAKASGIPYGVNHVGRGMYSTYGVRGWRNIKRVAKRLKSVDPHAHTLSLGQGGGSIRLRKINTKNPVLIKTATGRPSDTHPNNYYHSYSVIHPQKGHVGDITVSRNGSHTYNPQNVTDTWAHRGKRSKTRSLNAAETRTVLKKIRHIAGKLPGHVDDAGRKVVRNMTSQGKFRKSYIRNSQ